MPTYEFECSKCKKRQEEFLSIKERNKEIFCCVCKEKMNRLIGEGENIIFKGSGFYCNDYKKK